MAGGSRSSQKRLHGVAQVHGSVKGRPVRQRHLEVVLVGHAWPLQGHRDGVAISVHHEDGLQGLGRNRGLAGVDGRQQLRVEPMLQQAGM